MSIVVDLAEEVSSQKLTAIKALNAATVYSAALPPRSRATHNERSLECKKNSTLSSGSHLIELRE
jgi:hypothetical protein